MADAVPVHSDLPESPKVSSKLPKGKKEASVQEQVLQGEASPGRPYQVAGGAKLASHSATREDL